MTKKALYFEDVDLGDEIDPLEFNPTTEKVVGFTKIWTNETGPSRFTSDEVGKRDGFPAAIVPGIMSLAFLSQLVAQWTPSAQLRLLDVVFRQPLLHNQLLKATGVITDKSDKGDNLVEADVYLVDPQGQRRVGGKVKVFLPSRES